MAKCRMLIQENQELGRQLSQGRIAQLEAELALQKKYSEELKSSQDGKGFFKKMETALHLHWLHLFCWSYGYCESFHFIEYETIFLCRIKLYI